MIDRVPVELRLTGDNRHGVNEGLVWYHIDANVLDSPLVVVGRNVVDVWGIVANAALVTLRAYVVFASAEIVLSSFNFSLSPAVLKVERVP